MTETPTPMGFEPTRAEHIGLAGRRLNHSATVSTICFQVYKTNNQKQNTATQIGIAGV